MSLISSIFKNKVVNTDKLLSYGFTQRNNQYLYHTKMSECNFNLIVTVEQDGKVSAKVFDPVTEDEYTLHLVEGAEGSFVGSVKNDYEQILTDIAAKCFELNVFKSEQSKALIEYVRNYYGDELEFLWKKFSDNAIWRRKDTDKWYAALLTVSKRKLGITSDEIVEIIDLRATPDKVKTLVDNNKYFPGWHMNKKKWYTIILDNSVAIEDIIQKIEDSYNLAVK